MLHKRTNDWVGLREEKGVYVFDGWISPADHVHKKGKSIPNSRDEHVQKSKKSIANCRQEESKKSMANSRQNLMPYEHKVDMKPMDFPRQENRP